ncbi:MAG: ribonuclease HII [Deltaproteobacteria bacterium]|nr:MAG: ribonuclease HII [Deltaproteobacteria bacterium]
MKSLERGLQEKGYRFIAGVDEAGRGPLAGPVVAAAVILPSGYENPEIKDSKKLSPEKREQLFFRITSDAISYAIGVATPEEIDTFNIHNATLLAMERAIKMLDVKPDCVLVDGRFKIPSVLTDQIPVRDGDNTVLSIAAASIVAKVTRDMVMERYHDVYPEYNFAVHKGYPTREHRDALRKYGPSPIHRRSFRGTVVEGKE